MKPSSPPSNTLISFYSPAKINLFLHVGSVQANGLHNICSLNVFTSLRDTIHYFPDKPSGVSGLRDVPKESCYVSRLIDHIESFYAGEVKLGHFHIKKRIPIKAGLGGGSSNVANVFRAINSVHKLKQTELLFDSIGDKMGSDFFSCLQSETHLVSGTGEVISQVPKVTSNLLRKMGIMIVTPRRQRLSTPLVFNTRDRISRPLTNISSKLPTPPKSKKELILWLSSCRNDLTPAALLRAPIIGKIIKQLELLPECLFARMSGSGSSCFALFNSIASSKKAKDYLFENTYLKNSIMVNSSEIINNDIVLKAKSCDIDHRH